MDSSFGTWLRREIEQRLLTISDFAARVGVDESTIHRWLSTERPPIRGVNVVRLANALGVERDIIDERLADPAASAA